MQSRCTSRILSGASRLLSIRCNSSSCWKCGLSLRNKPFYLFCGCSYNVLLPPYADDYFAVFGIARSLEIETRQLTARFRELQNLIHPDKFSQKCQNERIHSAQQSAFVNRAYKTLLDPLSRGLYLLAEHGIAITEGEINTDIDFMSEMMELNELVADAASNEDVKQLFTTVMDKMQLCWQSAVKAHSTGDMDEVRSSLVHMRYYKTIQERLTEKTSDHLAEHISTSK
ncbi:iron-sulfur cluster co-chaperone protein HscB-like [Corticium candelabrum]|uniref:iron-sulfur cluster co-chaperone protein HscB-like n=1 Tax=Corticium candelabrum TaxID=121492 RepID=UPI002E27679E|nr:iron-sulfur cluster co-chaperone protein HscB-like [Corticium candelabrum]